MNYKIKITTLSDTIIATAEGQGSIIDTDICFDEFGIPYIPARRIKGCLRDSALEVYQLLNMLNRPTSTSFIDDIFGSRGYSPAKVKISNANIFDYKINKEWISYLLETSNTPFSEENVKKYFSQIRNMTEIDNERWIAKDKSLRNVRTLREGLDFEANLDFIEDPNQGTIDFLALSVKNLRYIGSNRTRGFGKIKCQLFYNNQPINPEIDPLKSTEEAK